MLNYLIVLLDDTSVSFCYYDNNDAEPHLISLKDLKQTVLFALKHNLVVQFVYPSHPLPQEYIEVIDTIDHCDIVPIEIFSGHEEIVVSDLNSLLQNQTGLKKHENTVFILRMCKTDLFAEYAQIVSLVQLGLHVNLVITDIASFSAEDMTTYREILVDCGHNLKGAIVSGTETSFSVLTDRLQLTEMNNCNACVEHLTVAPNGKFYVCPAFYYENAADSIGDLQIGIKARNAHLYSLEYSPLCKGCDAYQCRRCVWLNRKTTLEVNIPSREQCIVAHLERNASRDLLCEIRNSKADFNDGIRIPQIDYLDPMDVWKNK